MSEKSYLRQVSGALYERFNLVHKFKVFCQWCTTKFTFWSLVGICAVLEPVLCSKWPTTGILYAQVVVLAASSILFVIQLIGVASREWEKILMIEAMSSLQSIAIPKHMMDLSLLKILVFFAAEGEYILEFCMLLAGWILILWHPGLAALRCFRVFRLLWFYEVEVFRSSMEHYFNPIFGDVFVSRGFRVLKFAIKALSALGNEMFRLTADTKGALLLMMMFFYSAMVLGMSLWVETNAQIENCMTLGACTYTLMRLTFFDGNGFDFAYTLTSQHRILFFIVVLYMCLTSFGILNGLVGIFGTAMSRASDIAFEDEEDLLSAKEDYRQASSRNLYADDDPNDSSSRGGGEGSDKPDGSGSPADHSPGKLKGGFMSGGSGRSDKEGGLGGGVGSGAVSPEKQSEAGGSSKGGFKALVGKVKKVGATQPYDAVPGSDSLAAQYANLPRQKPDAPDRRRLPPTSSMFGRQPSMKMTASYANMSAAAAASNNASNAGANQSNAQINALTSQVKNLQRNLDKQSDMMRCMFDHILFLQEQLITAHPQLANLERPHVNEHFQRSPTVFPDSFMSPVMSAVGTPDKKNRLMVVESAKSLEDDEDVHAFSDKDS